MRIHILIAATVLVLVTVLSIVCADEPEMATVEGEHIILKVRTDDMALLTDPKAWVDKLDRAYEAYADLVGKTPFNGEKITILSVEEDPGGWAVAGNPIKWKRQYIASSFTENINKGDWLFGICHEIGHDFDLDDRWVWEPEFWANFKMDYVFEKCKAVVFFEKQVCDFGDPDSPRVCDLYRAGEVKAGTGDRVLHGGWPPDGFHHMYTDIVNEVGWDAMKRVFRWYNAQDPKDLPTGTLTKRSLFTRVIEEQSGAKLSAKYINWGFSYLTVEGQDAIGTAKILRAGKWTADIDNRLIKTTSGKKVTVGVTIAEANPIEVKKGLGTHAESELVYDLGGKYARFESYVGVPGYPANEGGWGSVGFEVIADGRKLYESPLLRGGCACKHVSVDITGVKELKLIVNDGGNGRYGDGAAWGDTKVTDAAGSVTYLSDLKPVSAKQGYSELHLDTDIDDLPLVFVYSPCAKPAKVVGKVDGKTINLQPTQDQGVYEYTFDGFDKGTHLVWLTIDLADSPITQHELITIQVE